VDYATALPQVNEERRAIAMRCLASSRSYPRFSQIQVLFADAIDGLLVSVDGIVAAAPGDLEKALVRLQVLEALDADHPLDA
jgi:hypothetical protein